MSSRFSGVFCWCILFGSFFTGWLSLWGFTLRKYPFVCSVRLFVMKFSLRKNPLVLDDCLLWDFTLNMYPFLLGDFLYVILR